MKLRIALLSLALLVPAAAMAQEHAGHGPAAEKPAAKFYPLTGVVTTVMTDRQALMVKHDEIPGVMRAMTMMFLVEPDVLDKVKKGDAIKAQMGRNEAGKWILREVEIVAERK